MASNIFNSSKYAKAYFQLVESAKQNPSTADYNEIHHILPKSLGGSDDESNLVKFSLRQHYIAHLLLVKMVSSVASQAKMIYALNMMGKTRVDSELKFNSHLYDKLKTKYWSRGKSQWHHPDTHETIVLFEDELPPPEFVKGGTPRSEEWKAKLGRYERSDEWIEATAKRSLGKKHYTNDLTGEAVFVEPDNAPTGDGWREGTKAKGKSREKFKVVTNVETGVEVHLGLDESLPDGFVNRRITSEKRKIASRRVCEIMHKMANNKNRSAYYNLETLEQRNLKPDEEIPEGWIKGRSPSGIHRGHKQSTLQKEAASKARAKTYIVTFEDGSEKQFTGLAKWLVSRGAKYRELHETCRKSLGIIKVVNLGVLK